MSFTSFHFGLFVIISFIANNYCRGKTTYGLVAFLINLAFFSSFFDTLLGAVPIVIFLITAYFLVVLSFYIKKPFVLFISLFAVMMIFSYLKKYTFVSWSPELPFVYTVIGMSYILFRVIHLIVDVYEGSIKDKIGFIDFINYCCFFLVLVSGPIVRYQDFSLQYLSKESSLLLSREDVVGAFSRILTGYIKIVGLSALFIFLFSTFNQEYWQLKVGTGGKVVAVWFGYASVTYFFHLYFNFTGYMDVVIGLGILFGYRLPENFNKPLLASSFLEFWTRWHITLSEWFRTYFFNPLVKWLNGVVKDSNKHVVSIGILGYFATFLVIGYWHTPSICLAILLGVGAAVNKIFQGFSKQIFGKKRMKRLNGNDFFNYICRGLTISYLAISIAFLWMDYREIYFKYSFVWIAVSFFMIWAVVGAVSAMAMVIYDKLARFANRFHLVIENQSLSCMATNAWLVSKLFIILYASLITINPTPAFIYMGF